MTYQFPVEAMRGFQPFESYHDEGLGVDVHGKRERQQIMAAKGLVEAGDTSGGHRNFDESNAVSALPEQGVRLSDIQRINERAARMKDDQRVSTLDKNGEVTNVYRHGDLPTSTKKAFSLKREE